MCPVPWGAWLSSGTIHHHPSWQVSSEEVKIKKNKRFAPRHLLLPLACSIPKIIPFLVTGASFRPKISHPNLLRVFCLPEQRAGPPHRTCISWAKWGCPGKWSLRGTQNVFLKIALWLFCVYWHHIFPLVLFQFAVWSKCWVNALFYVTFIFENDFIKYNTGDES